MTPFTHKELYVLLSRLDLDSWDVNMIVSAIPAEQEKKMGKEKGNVA